VNHPVCPHGPSGPVLVCYHGPHGATAGGRVPGRAQLDALSPCASETRLHRIPVICHGVVQKKLHAKERLAWSHLTDTTEASLKNTSEQTPGSLPGCAEPRCAARDRAANPHGAFAGSEKRVWIYQRCQILLIEPPCLVDYTSTPPNISGTPAPYLKPGTDPEVPAAASSPSVYCTFRAIDAIAVKKSNSGYAWRVFATVRDARILIGRSPP